MVLSTLLFSTTDVSLSLVSCGCVYRFIMQGDCARVFFLRFEFDRVNDTGLVLAFFGVLERDDFKLVLDEFLDF